MNPTMFLASDLLEWLTAIGSIATPLLVLVLSGIGYSVKTAIDRRTTSQERRDSLEDQLRPERVANYDQIIEPFIILLMSEEAWKRNPANKGDKNELATQKLLSLEYRIACFKMVFLGSDEVVRAYNALMQAFYGHDSQTSLDPETLMRLLGSFLLQIRRSSSNQATKLNNIEMLEWLLKDAAEMKK